MSEPLSRKSILVLTSNGSIRIIRRRGGTASRVTDDYIDWGRQLKYLTQLNILEHACMPEGVVAHSIWEDIVQFGPAQFVIIE